MYCEVCPLNTVCHTQLSFANLESKAVVATFDGGKITSDGGCLLLREIDERVGVIDSIHQALVDPRDPAKIRHHQSDLLRQRVLAIALGYEDCNDHDTLRFDPALKTAVGRAPDSAADLASQPTFSRLENRVDARQLVRLSRQLMEGYIAAHPGDRKLIVLDVDSTDDATHGRQQMSLFHGYYDQHMYHPLVVFDGVDGYPLAAVLRPGNAHAAKGAVGILRNLIRRLQKAYPNATVLVRADGGFASPAIYRLLERLHVRYTIGLITNDRLKDHVADLIAETAHAHAASGEKQRAFTSFRYRAGSWDTSRRVIAKVEQLAKGANTRFVVTNLRFETPQQVYDGLYVGRGDAENRIKELKLHLKADRTSCHRFAANQFRLLLHTFAFVLLWHLRQAAAGTELATATFETLRLRLLKIGARVQETVRRIVLHMASSYPYQRLFADVAANIQAMPLRL